MKIKNIREIEKPKVVYNLHVEKNHNYVANGLVVSNCHTAKGEALKAVLGQVMCHIPLRWGLTGTIPKDEVQAMQMRCNIGDVIAKVSAAELQDNGVLSKCQVKVLQLASKLEFEDYASELKWLVSDEKRMNYIADLIQIIS